MTFVFSFSINAGLPALPAIFNANRARHHREGLPPSGGSLLLFFLARGAHRSRSGVENVTPNGSYL